MYKVFYNNKPMILTGRLSADLEAAGIQVFRVSSGKTLKEAFHQFRTAPVPEPMVLYNNGCAGKLLDDFISMFWYLEASGGIVRNEKGQRLFIRRFGRWDLPKGKIKKNESPERAAVREVTEETGISAPIIESELPSTFHIYEYKGKRILKRTYWYAMHYYGDETPVPQLEEEITEARWMGLDGLDQICANTYASLTELIKLDTEQRG